jgi:hypothetical protein
MWLFGSGLSASHANQKTKEQYKTSHQRGDKKWSKVNRACTSNKKI